MISGDSRNRGGLKSRPQKLYTSLYMVPDCKFRECINSGLDYWNGVIVEWWNSGMVDWIIFYFVFIIYHVVASL